MSKKNRVVLSFFGVLLGIALVWFVFNGLVWVYCSDAYIRADLATVSPRIEGHLLEVKCLNNQMVRKGQLLLRIDPYPYQLQRDVKKASLAQQLVQLQIINSQLDTAIKEEKAVRITYDLAKKNLLRYRTLMKEDATAQERLDKVNSDYETAVKNLDAAVENVRMLRQSQQSQQALIDLNKAELALAEYNLQQTEIVAPCDGFVTNIACRPGDFVQPGTLLFGMVDAEHWWVEANYKEYLLRRIRPGRKVYIVADLYPLRVYIGEVENISRGTLRNSDSRTVLPTVSPTTDWVRLSQRFQVRIKFREPLRPKDQFYMGSDVRTLIPVW